MRRWMVPLLQALITPTIAAVDSLCVGLWMDATVGNVKVTSPDGWSAVLWHRRDPNLIRKGPEDS